MSDFTRVPPSAFVGNAVASSAVAQADYEWLVENGADSYDAAKRTIGATTARWVVGLFAAPWLLIVYYVGNLLLFVSTPQLFLQHSLRWEMPVFDNGFTMAEDSWSAPAEAGHQWLWALLGALVCFALVYGTLLVFAHIWRWQSDTVPGYNDGKRWWRLYKRPVMNTIYPPGDPRRGARYGFATAMKWVFLYIPAAMIPVYFAATSAASLLITVVHNV